MEILLLAAYVTAAVLILIAARSLTRAVLGAAVGLSVGGVLINVALDAGIRVTGRALQAILLAVLLLTAAVLWRHRPQRESGRRELLAVGVPVLVAAGFMSLVTIAWTSPDPAFWHPVSFLIGHSNAEDNAKWLDFAAQFASGQSIDQAVPMGGPLQLIMAFWATAMGAVSEVVFGGVNQVAVAANAVIFAQLGFVVIAPLALAPLARGVWGRTIGADRIPAPAIWIGSVPLVAAVLVVTGYGHLTFQYSLIVVSLWSAVFLAGSTWRDRVLASLVVAAAMTVWLPLNGLAAVIALVVLGMFVRGTTQAGWRSLDRPLVAAWLVVIIGISEPIRSSFAFVLNSGDATAGVEGGAAIRGVSTAVTPVVTSVRGFLDDAGLFSSPGGTEPIGAVLAILAAAACAAAALWMLRSEPHAHTRFLPIAALAAYASLIYGLDAWVTGSAPNYGSLKFGFLAIIVILATTLPIAVCSADPGATRMTALRWGVVLGSVLLLMVDTLLPRSLAAARPEQWSPALPFSNTQSWWWPADVKSQGQQPISTNPIGCVYLPNGAQAPTALLASQLSGGDRVYACTRVLAGLGGVDREAQPLVDWLRREWLTNTPAWNDVHGYLAGMPADVRARPLILLDDLSNVIGTESLDSLLQRFPPRAPQ